MQKTKRILAIDVMRGLTLFLMLFVNDLNSAGVPEWLTHRDANFDGMGLADWVFPGFLFMVGMAVPFAIQNRIKLGNSNFRITFHVISRTLSLLVIGVLMVNASRVNAELTGIGKNLWAILMYFSVFLVWNSYKNVNKFYLYFLKGLGIIGLLILVLIFKSGNAENITWIQKGWWGILGLIGWGYFVSALVYLAAKENLLKTGFFWLVFIALNVLSQLGLLNPLNFLNPVFGVILNGNTPSIVMAGLFFSLLLRKTGDSNFRKFVSFGFVLGIILLIGGFILRNWFIISKIKGTPSWAMVCNGISVLLFLVLFILIDILGKKKWTIIFKPAGQNSLTTYLAPDILYYSIWMAGLPVFFYKNSEHALIVILGSIVWAFLMVAFAALLSKIGIKLKL